MATRTATAVWLGSLREGRGSVSTGTKLVSDLEYNFGQRFADEPGTNPEELIAAAHSACFSMALSAELGKASLNPERVETKANLTFEKKEKGFTVTRIHLETTASVPGATKEAFDAAVEAARTGCPISRLLDTEITVNATLA
jgi:lipoyl-dependent peroxiredoxin